MSNTIIELAHHLGPQEAGRLGLEPGDYVPGTALVLRSDHAEALIAAGYAEVDAEDRRAVERAKRRHAPKDHPVGVLREAPEAEESQPTEAQKVNPTSTDPGPNGVAPASASGSTKNDKKS